MRIMSALGVIAVGLVALQPASAADRSDRFVEFHTEFDTITSDLKTVKTILPGRFTVINTVIENRDLMNLRLKTIDAFRRYCDRQDGKYQAPADVLTLGPSDMPTKPVEVWSGLPNTPSEGEKHVFWEYPYKELALNNGDGKPELFICKGGHKTENQWYLDQRNDIMNGSKFKELFDCNRGIKGDFLSIDDDMSKVILEHFVPLKIVEVGVERYIKLCYDVIGKLPYFSNALTAQDLELIEAIARHR